jgi:hypothetical protein
VAHELDGRFDLLWIELARQGTCDAMGSKEYQRVKAEWIAANRPRPIVFFIEDHANRPGGPVLPPEGD